MLTGIWTIGIKVPNLERELEFHQQLGNELVLDETIEFEGESFRIPLIKMGDKYLHLAEKAVYENLLPEPLPFGMTHLVYMSDSLDQDVAKAVAAGAVEICPIANVSAEFGERRVGFLRSPTGWVFEIIEIKTSLVPEV